MSGIGGAMGRAMLSACSGNDKIKIVAGVDIKSGEIDGIPIYASFGDCKDEIDVVVDFSTPVVLDSLIDYCRKNRKPAVICTTGYSEEQELKVRELSKDVAVFRSANMSLGVNLIASLAKTASKILGEGFDIEIIEKHHRKKVDAPSGTAMMLAKEINAANDNRYRFVYERESVRQPRNCDEIGISAVRGGTIVGEHEILFAGTDEVITLSHSATSKSVFATGAVSAALYLAKQSVGFYNMDNLIDEM